MERNYSGQSSSTPSSHGLERKVRLVGFDAGEPLMQAVAEGTIDALILQDPHRMGYLGTWAMVQHLRGYDVVSEPDAELPARSVWLATMV